MTSIGTSHGSITVINAMPCGIGATIGTLGAQQVVNHFTVDGVTEWQSCWYIFAAYALVVGIAFALIFRPKKV
mgnify:CR=1 FL=1